MRFVGFFYVIKHPKHPKFSAIQIAHNCKITICGFNCKIQYFCI